MRSGLLALALAAAACAHPGSTAQLDPNAPTTVKVENDNVLDMNVYVLSGGPPRGGARPPHAAPAPPATPSTGEGGGGDSPAPPSSGLQAAPGAPTPPP